MSKDFPWLPEARARYRAVGQRSLPRNVIALLEQAAALHPDRVALHFIETGRELTYAALLESVRRLANGFTHAGIGRGSPVGVMLANVPEMPITWLALAAIGAVMVPANTRYTAHELHYLLADAGATHLVIQADFAPLLAALPEPLPGLVTIVAGDAPGNFRWQELHDRGAATFAPAVEPALDDLLNIQYTSGTTGWPKGCRKYRLHWFTG